MDGLLMISYLNTLRPMECHWTKPSSRGQLRVRPGDDDGPRRALFGLLPAALSTQIGSQTQRPLAIVVVGGMTTTILLTRYLMPVLYSFYGHRDPPAAARGLAP